MQIFDAQTRTLQTDNDSARLSIGSNGSRVRRFNGPRLQVFTGLRAFRRQRRTSRLRARQLLGRTGFRFRVPGSGGDVRRVQRSAQLGDQRLPVPGFTCIRARGQREVLRVDGLPVFGRGHRLPARRDVISAHRSGSGSGRSGRSGRRRRRSVRRQGSFGACVGRNHLR